MLLRVLFVLKKRHGCVVGLGSFKSFGVGGAASPTQGASSPWRVAVLIPIAPSCIFFCETQPRFAFAYEPMSLILPPRFVSGHTFVRMPGWQG